MDRLEKFKDIFEPQLIEALNDKAVYKEFKAGATIIEIGQRVRFIPIILKGNIKVVRTDEDGNELLLYYVNSQESCAMSFTCCNQDLSSEIRAVAEDDVEVLMVPNNLMDERLVYYLKEKSKITGSALINLSHEQIANDLATSRVVISRLLKKFENRNQIKLLSSM